MTNVKTGDLAVTVDCGINSGATTTVGESVPPGIYLARCTTCEGELLIGTRSGKHWQCVFSRDLKIETNNTIHTVNNIPFPDAYLRKLTGPDVPETELDVFSPGPIDSEERLRVKEERNKKGTVV